LHYWSREGEAAYREAEWLKLEKEKSPSKEEGLRTLVKEQLIDAPGRAREASCQANQSIVL